MFCVYLDFLLLGFLTLPKILLEIILYVQMIVYVHRSDQMCSL